MDIPLTKEGLNIAYDKDTDILYITMGAACASVSIDTNDGNLMSVDPTTDEVVGITLLDFKERHLESANEKSDYNGGRRERLS